MTQRHTSAHTTSGETITDETIERLTEMAERGDRTTGQAARTAPRTCRTQCVLAWDSTQMATA